MIKKYTQKSFIEKANICSPSVEIIGEFITVKDQIKAKCKSNPDHVFERCAYKFIKSDYEQRCPFCYKEKFKYLNRGKKCIFETHPEIAKMLKNQEEGYMYSFGSTHKTTFVCNKCGKEICNSFNYITGRGYVCDYCNKIQSYANGYMYNLLTQSGIDFVDEYVDFWTDNKRYDFYFEIDCDKYAVEMDGKQHYDSESNIENDAYKNKLAKENNVKLIRINCSYDKYSERENIIKNNILSSELRNIIDFSKIDFNQCNLHALKNNISMIVDLWNENNNVEYVISNSKIKRDGTLRLLKEAAKNNLINMSLAEMKEEIKRNGINISKGKSITTKEKYTKPIRCIETGEIFKKPTEAIKKYPNASALYHCISDPPTQKHAGKLPDGTMLSWELIPI